MSNRIQTTVFDKCKSTGAHQEAQQRLARPGAPEALDFGNILWTLGSDRKEIVVVDFTSELVASFDTGADLERLRQWITRVLRIKEGDRNPAPWVSSEGELGLGWYYADQHPVLWICNPRKERIRKHYLTSDRLQDLKAWLSTVGGKK